MIVDYYFVDFLFKGPGSSWNPIVLNIKTQIGIIFIPGIIVLTSKQASGGENQNGWRKHKSKTA